MATITTTTGHQVLVDDTDVEWLSTFTWATKVGDKPSACRYAITWAKSDGRRRNVRMHRLILGAVPGELVDHRNRDTLDNRRSNLRIVTAEQNVANAVGWTGARSQYRGVDLHRGRWRARFYAADGRRLNLGQFASEIEAARAWNEAALERWGADALLNPC